MTLLLGVDGCPGGWCAVALEVGDGRARPAGARVYSSVAEILAADAAVICIDIPIGLLDVPGQRRCDVEARRLLGPAWPRVFIPPCRQALGAPDYRTTCAVNQQLTGRMISKQCFGIMPKIREVDEVLEPAYQERVREAHPELCFWALAGRRPVSERKKKPEGRARRWQLLRGVFSSLPDAPLGGWALPLGCAPDDYIDALVCAWTAACVLQGTARRIPQEPEPDERGLRMEMWLPAEPPNVAEPLQGSTGGGARVTRRF